MANLHSFLVEHAKFPFPPPDECQSASTTDISPFWVGMLKAEWKAKHAVWDNVLVQKLCHTLKNILKDTPLTVEVENYLLAAFSPNIEFDKLGKWAKAWSRNPSEAHVNSCWIPDHHFEAKQFELTIEAESDVAGKGVLHHHGELFVGIWSL